jgi:transcriptional regulator with XRE-family HTH domain/tetratricopeptide (TPR) repeat protein
MNAGLTQEQLAERSGLSVRAIRDIESGRVRRPRQSTAQHIANVLHAPASQRGAGASDPEPARPAQLPADLADFTGRTAEVSRLTARLAGAAHQPSAAVAVVAVAGPGGIGKTSLALHAGHQVTSHFPDGQLYLNLRGSSAQPVPAAEALARFLRDLGIDPAALPVEQEERAARYRSLTAGRRLLIVLDDAGDAAQVRPLIPGSGGCAVIVTSRRSLHDLEAAQLLDLASLADGEASEMFTAIVGPARAAAEPAAVLAVLAACSGLPLAIRIVAARLVARPAWTVASVASKLADERSRLDQFETGDLAVRASFQMSYAHLGTEGRATGGRVAHLFRILTLAAGPEISLPAAAALLGVPSGLAEPGLELLVDMHLLESAATGRYRFHDLIRVYASELMLSGEDVKICGAATRRMLSWYLHTAGAACRRINPHHPHLDLGTAEPGVVPLAFDGHDDALAWLDAEHANLLAAVGQAARLGEHDIAWQLPATLWDLFDLRGHIGDWLSAHLTGLASARLLSDRRAEKRMLGNLAGNYLYIGQPQAALECVRQILDIARQLGDVGGTAVALVNLGVSLAELGRGDEAIGPMREALVLFRSIGERNGEAFALCGIGGIQGLRGELSAGVSQYEQGLAILREIGNLASAAESLAELSSLRLKLDDPDAAIAEATEAVELSRQVGARRVEGAAMAVLGRAYRARSEPERARACWLDAFAVFSELGHPQAATVAADLSALSDARPA